MARIGSLPEKVRPKSLSEIAGFTEVVHRLEQLEECLGFVGNSFFLVGKSGVGKTTIARIIASKVADPTSITEIDAQDLTLEKLRDFESNCAYRPLFGDGYALIVNECHMISGRVCSRLLTLMESPEVQANGCLIFTTTDTGAGKLFDTREDAMPFVTRCVVLELQPGLDDYQAMAHRVSQVAKQYGFGDIPVERSFELIQNVGGSMRAALQTVASGAL